MSRQASATTRSRLRSLSSGSMTPVEDEEEAPKRSTRGRNPLPPTSGPLFPPLPPKVPKPKASKSPNHTATASASGSGSQHQSQMDEVEEAEAAGALHETEAHIPTGSGGSLSPPPDGEPDAEGTPTQTTTARWRSGKVSPAQQSIDIKLEEAASLSSANGSSANGNGTSKARRYSSHLAPPDSAGDSESDAASARRKNRRRRGEDQLLFDDHLLPEELRQTGKLMGKRARESYTSATSDGNRSTKRRNSSFKRDEDEEAVADDEDERPVQARAGSAAVPATIAQESEEGEGEPKGKEDQGTDADISEPPPEDPEPPNAAGAVEEDEAVDDTVPEDVEEDAEVDENEEAEDDEGDADEDGGGEEITRCVCQREDGDPLMISCETCMVWQHMPCVGIWSDPESPDEYFCEKCRPDLHGPLKKWIRSRGRNIENFLPPTPDDLKAFHSPHDKHPPSQSKRWLTAPASKKGKKDDKSKDKEKEEDKGQNRVKDEKAHKVKSKDASPERRRSTAGGRDAKEMTMPLRDKPESGRQTSRRPSSHGPPSHGAAQSHTHTHKPVSIMVDAPSSPSMRDSQSPMTFSREPKRRSTMNSRDAAIEEEDLRRAMEESRREMKEDGEEGHGAQDEAAQEDNALAVPDHEKDKEEEEKIRKEKGKGKVARREEEPPAPNKPKHPNQYTYRPKPSGPIPTPARRGGQGGTPVPTLGPALHDHGTRRAGALATGAREAPFIAVQSDGLGWNLPDHLAQYTSLLPSPTPDLLSVRSPRPMANLSKSHFLNYRYGPFEEKRDPVTGKLIMPTDGPERDVTGEPGEKHTENPAKPRWPPRRMTAVEMRKRVRSMLEFVGKVQLDEDKRAQRRKELGITEFGYEQGKEGSKRRKVTPVPAGEQNEAAGKLDGEAATDEDIDMESKAAEAGESSMVPSTTVNGSATAGSAAEDTIADTEPNRATSPPAKSMSTGPPLSQLLADIMSELVEFEDTWMRPGGAGGSLAPAAGKGTNTHHASALSISGTPDARPISDPSMGTSAADASGVGGNGDVAAVSMEEDKPTEEETTPEGGMDDEAHQQVESPGEAEPTNKGVDVSPARSPADRTESDATAQAPLQPAEPIADSQIPIGSDDADTAVADSTEEAPPMGIVSEKLADPVEVYREGEVDTVVARPEETAAAELIEREAASTLGNQPEDAVRDQETSAADAEAHTGATLAQQAPGEVPASDAPAATSLADQAASVLTNVQKPEVSNTEQSGSAAGTVAPAVAAPVASVLESTAQVQPLQTAEMPNVITPAVDVTLLVQPTLVQPLAGVSAAINQQAPTIDMPANPSMPVDLSSGADLSLDMGMGLGTDLPQLTEAEMAELINMPIDENIFAGMGMPGFEDNGASNAIVPDLAAPATAGVPVQPDQPGATITTNSIAQPDIIPPHILGEGGGANVGNELDMYTDADLTALLAQADNADAIAGSMPGLDGLNGLDAAQMGSADPMATFVEGGLGTLPTDTAMGVSGAVPVQQPTAMGDDVEMAE